jgi:hypothetical protein
MRKFLPVALVAATLLIPVASPAVAVDEEVRQCVRHIAELERLVARETRGAERREIINVLGQAKVACMKGEIAAAYQGVARGLQMAKKAPKG